MLELCWKAGIPLRGIMHDMSKFSPVELREAWKYADGEKSLRENCMDAKGFSEAWLHHKGHNPHHPEYWIDRETNEPKDMPDIYIAEMLLDWAGMGIKFGDTAYEYYMKERDNKPLSENTKKKIVEIKSPYISFEIFKEYIVPKIS